MLVFAPAQVRLFQAPGAYPDPTAYTGIIGQVACPVLAL